MNDSLRVEVLVNKHLALSLVWFAEEKCPRGIIMMGGSLTQMSPVCFHSSCESTGAHSRIDFLLLPQLSQADYNTILEHFELNFIACN